MFAFHEASIPIIAALVVNAAFKAVFPWRDDEQTCLVDCMLHVYLDGQEELYKQYDEVFTNAKKVGVPVPNRDEYNLHSAANVLLEAQCLEVGKEVTRKLEALAKSASEFAKKRGGNQRHKGLSFEDEVHSLLQGPGSPETISELFEMFSLTMPPELVNGEFCVRTNVYTADEKGKQCEKDIVVMGPDGKPILLIEVKSNFFDAEKGLEQGRGALGKSLNINGIHVEVSETTPVVVITKPPRETNYLPGRGVYLTRDMDNMFKSYCETGYARPRDAKSAKAEALKLWQDRFREMKKNPTKKAFAKVAKPPRGPHRHPFTPDTKKDMLNILMEMSMERCRKVNGHFVLEEGALQSV